MTTLRIIEHRETLTEATARRLRGLLAERRVSSTDLAKATYLSRSSIGRRLTGETALNTDELEVIAGVLGVPVAYLVVGGETQPPPARALLPHLDSNQEHSDSRFPVAA